VGGVDGQLPRRRHVALTVRATLALVILSLAGSSSALSARLEDHPAVDRDHR
jgi:hypothetical protein